ncbi:hypothetical protein SEUBUCD646_0G02980 [Saccharomyces eubayanus]|uniref:Uncharacterized protein n=2 Tax=Saccharomyces TaxID=4930 RepID=A0A6C1E8T4_SACPS|nr:hypothetical protein DI49_1998 [Saccharomyces eubayanus]KOG99534.1 hypothetical protein DI49_1998 [Saccharomyces eubayanus]QID85107.1 hypothetical protein GRS66_007659 [Saccharomyces pastorianus]CAI2001850.1 hypothetical protein SEUBUCD650_0G02960 [Saccharomyces eubayanus]CAI2021883.1 hypothetical protein SEUBUCD646_0G02980 [Saccharomyces eubayanus]
MLLTPANLARPMDTENSDNNSSKNSNSFMRSIVSSLMVKPISSLTNTVTRNKGKGESTPRNSTPNKITRYDLFKAAADNDLKRSKTQERAKSRRGSNSRYNDDISVSSPISGIQRSRSSI